MTDQDSQASPPCALGELQPEERVSGAEAVAGWRARERERLRRLRRSLDPATRAAADAAIAAGLDKVLADAPAGAVAVYWPLGGEPRLERWYAAAAGRGVALALPVVVRREQPLEFRAWQPGAALETDALNIPAPLHGKLLSPAVVITPCLGYDEARYRLGNGGGYYDRTLAGAAERPLLVGVAYAACALRTIYPQAHDVPLDTVVTETGVIGRPQSRNE